MKRILILLSCFVIINILSYPIICSVLSDIYISISADDTNSAFAMSNENLSGIVPIKMKKSGMYRQCTIYLEPNKKISTVKVSFNHMQLVKINSTGIIEASIENHAIFGSNVFLRLADKQHVISFTVLAITLGELVIFTLFIIAIIVLLLFIFFKKRIFAKWVLLFISFLGVCWLALRLWQVG